MKELELLLLEKAKIGKAADRYSAMLNAAYKRIAKNIKKGNPPSQR